MLYGRKKNMDKQNSSICTSTQQRKGSSQLWSVVQNQLVIILRSHLCAPSLESERLVILSQCAGLIGFLTKYATSHN